MKTLTPMDDRVLDAAVRLLRTGGSAFSMRELAAEAGVSFATPFNRFGSKAGLMQALSGRLIDAMEARLDAAELPRDAPSRVAAAAGIACSVMLADAPVNKAAMAALGAPADAQGSVLQRSGAYWAIALADGRGLAPSLRVPGLAVLPGQLAVAFRGVLSFWTAGEIADAALADHAGTALSWALLGFAGGRSRAELLSRLAPAGR